MTLKTINIKILLFTFLVYFLQLSHAATKQNNERDLQMERAILIHINLYRQQHGLSPLTMDKRISNEARTHSLAMAQHTLSFGHKYFNSRITRLRAQIKNTKAGAENVAYNYKDAQDVVKNWVLSPGHKRNIEGRYNLTGIGIARDSNSKIYFTQIFLSIGGDEAPRRRLKHFLN